MSSKREHSKSRLGCKQCKRRRIKCDETPPRCENCKKKDLECDYQDWEDVFRNVQFLTPPILPRANCLNAPENTVESLPNNNSAYAFTLEDLGLHYHFVMHTSLTMDCNGEHADQLWQREVPRIAQQHAFLMHAVLAFAAIHLAKTTGKQDPRNEQLARQHYGQALILFRQSVASLSGDKAEALLCFGILINFVTINLNMEEAAGEKDVIANFANRFAFLHNSFQMFMPMRQSIQAGVVATELRRAFNAVQPQPIEFDANNSLDCVTELARRRYSGPAVDLDQTVLIEDALIKLRQFYTLVPPHPTSWARILSFPLQLDSGFSTLVQQRDPIALCILAHWCVPFHNAPRRWYFSDPARSLMLAIAEQLKGTEWSEGIRWPVSQTTGVTDTLDHV